MRTHSRTDISDQVINAMTRTSDGGFAATGYTVRTGNKDVFAAKFDCTGQRRWWSTFGGSGDDEGRGIVETSDGYLIIVGSTRSRNDGADFLISKRPSNNQGLGWSWTRIWGGGIGQDEELHGIIEATNGDVWVTGYTRSYSSWPAYRPQAVLARLSPDGLTLIGTVAGNPAISREYKGFALAQVFGDYPGFCVVGTVSGAAFGQDALLAKFSLTGALMWAERFGDAGSRDEVATSIIRTSTGCLAIAGCVNHSDVYPNNKGGFLVKTGTDAQVVWGRFAAGMSPYYSRYCKSVVETHDGGLVVTGADHSPSMYADRVILSKWNSGGATMWNRGFAAGELCVGNSVLVDTDHSLLVAGATQGDATGQYDVLVGRWCSTGFTCLPEGDGPLWSSWNPGQQRIDLPPPDSSPFAETLTAWSVAYAADALVTSTICEEPTIRTVRPDGSGDYPTIQEAINASFCGDIILLTDGVFSGAGNRDISFLGKAVMVRSQNGPQNCSIEVFPGGALRVSPHRGFSFINGEGRNTVLEGVSVVRGNMFGPNNAGGAIVCVNSSPTIRNCWIKGNSAAGDGGGVWCANSASPLLEWCVITGNKAGRYGGGLFADQSCSVEVSHCSISGNRAVQLGGGVYGRLVPRHSIIHGNGADAGIGDEWYGDGGCYVEGFCDNMNQGGLHGFSSCVIWGRLGPNIYVPPFFWGPRSWMEAPTVAGDYRLHPNSPCSPAGQPVCGLIGALDVVHDFPFRPMNIESPDNQVGVPGGVIKDRRE